MSTYKVVVKDRIYRVYITDGLKAIGNLNARYADLIKFNPQNYESAEDVIKRLSDKLQKIGGE